MCPTFAEDIHTRDLIRKAELLLAYDLGQFAKSKAWNDLMDEGRDLTVLAYTALVVETHRPGVVPTEILASLSTKIKPERLGTGCINLLANDAVEYIEEINALLEQSDDLRRIVAYNHVSELIESRKVNPESIQETHNRIAKDVEAFEHLVAIQEGAVA